MKVEILLKSFYILATGLKNVKKHGVTILNFFAIFWRLFLEKKDRIFNKFFFLKKFSPNWRKFATQKTLAAQLTVNVD
jgi:hypothetical protein